VSILAAIIATFEAAGGGGGGGTDVTPDAINWADIGGVSPQSNAAQTFTGINTAIEITFSYTGTGTPFITATKNGSVPFTSGDSVESGDTLSFSVSTFGADATGTVTIVNASDSNTTLDTFAVNVADPGV